MCPSGVRVLGSDLLGETLILLAKLGRVLLAEVLDLE
jgi:hypothetical protein